MSLYKLSTKFSTKTVDGLWGPPDSISRQAKPDRFQGCSIERQELKFAPLTRRVSSMWEIIQAAGWPIWPLIFASIIALAIIGERAFALRATAVAPPQLLAQVIQELQQTGANAQLIARLMQGAPLARILAAGLQSARASRDVMRESIEETGRAVGHELERFLTTLGTIAAMSPLLGLFGTTVGMIEMFSAQTPTGLNPVQLAHGISVALYNTAFGLVVAIPSMIFYRHYRAKVDALIINMEQQAVRLVDIVHGARTS